MSKPRRSMSYEPDRVTDEQDRDLVEKYPLLYSVRHTTRYGLRWGFAVQQGWMKLIYDLSAKLESEIESLPSEDRAAYHCLQVKQKFGGLRFYMSKTTDEMRKLINEAEDKSWDTCEKCGAVACMIYPNGTPAQIIGHRETLCSHHANQRALADQLVG